MFDPRSKQQSLILNPDNPDHKLARDLLNNISTPYNQTWDEYSVESLLVQWVISSNRTHIAKLSPDKHLKSMNTNFQYVMISASPEKEEEFQALKARSGSSFAFHGSRVENWHSILRNGLKNASGTGLQLNGAAYGKGIYLSTASYMSLGYSMMGFTGVGGGTVKDEEVLADGKWICLALCEVINDPSIKKSGQIWVVPKENCVTTRFFFVYKAGSATANVASNTGELLKEIENALA